MAVGAMRVRPGLLVCDGRPIALRPIRGADVDLLIEFHNRLSARTQYLRFFGPKPQLTPQEAQYLANVDFESRFAIVACGHEDGAERILAVGRFDMTGAATGEAAIAVRDDYQRRGLGTAIFERLLEAARARGVESLSGEVLAENEQMIGFLRTNNVDVGAARAGVCGVTYLLRSGPLPLRLRTCGVDPSSVTARDD